jgi:hypothetical protein
VDVTLAARTTTQLTATPRQAEAVEILFDPRQTTYRDILAFFFQVHDALTLNRQGNAYRPGPEPLWHFAPLPLFWVMGGLFTLAGGFRLATHDVNEIPLWLGFGHGAEVSSTLIHARRRRGQWCTAPGCRSVGHGCRHRRPRPRPLRCRGRRCEPPRCP